MIITPQMSTIEWCGIIGIAIGLMAIGALLEWRRQKM